MRIRKILIALIIMIILSGTFFACENTSVVMANTRTNMAVTTVEEQKNQYQGLIINADKLIPDKTDLSTLQANTAHLQECIDKASNSGGGKVKLPAGTFYFAAQSANVRKNEDYVIKARDNVILEGAGIDETNPNNYTILKPYGKVGELTDAIVGGLDMFYYNDYRDYNEARYLDNADFKNFIIDGENTEKKGSYNSSGKGFMFLLVKNCDYENIIVRNTEATGFGMDCPINCTIKNCIAINCGRSASPTDVGGSGFGIGTGYDKENEYIYISNCTALGNKKFGFFFENQTRFCGGNTSLYPAQSSKGYVVFNCVASGNMYDFGGARGHDITYENCISNNDYINENVTHVSAFNFESMCRRIHIINCTSEQQFIDVTDSSEFYYNPVYWALNNGIASGITQTEFAPYQPVTRAEAITFLWRTAERPGEVPHSTGDLLNQQFEGIYDDVPSDAYYVDAIKWAKETNIVSPTNNILQPNRGCTRAEVITMLWRYAIAMNNGEKPQVDIKRSFRDIPSGAYYEEAANWAASRGILKGTSPNTFSPNKTCSRAEIVTFLYRYSKTKNNFVITYNLGAEGLEISNPHTYKAGYDEFTLKNPTRNGYTFLGWTGSSYQTITESTNYVPKLKVKITKEDVGNKTFTAHWAPNSYELSFNSNGGTGTMNTQYFVYDDVPQELLENTFAKTGYIFNGWNSKADGTGISFENAQAIQNLTTMQNAYGVLYAQWLPTKVQYTVEHYKQNLNGKYSTKPTVIERFKAVVDTKVTPKTKIFSGYIRPISKTVIVEEDGSTVVKYYYPKIMFPQIRILKNKYMF